MLLQAVTVNNRLTCCIDKPLSETIGVPQVFSMRKKWDALNVAVILVTVTSRSTCIYINPLSGTILPAVAATLNSPFSVGTSDSQRPAFRHRRISVAETLSHRCNVMSRNLNQPHLCGRSGISCENRSIAGATPFPRSFSYERERPYSTESLITSSRTFSSTSERRLMYRQATLVVCLPSFVSSAGCFGESQMT